VFAGAATVSSLIHFGLFEPGRLITWMFFELYLLVSTGAWYFLIRYQAATSIGPPLRLRQS